jgi:uncharacterized Zn-finger protein
MSGSALVEFESNAAARMAIKETGFPDDKIKVKTIWIETVQCGDGGSVQLAPGVAADGASSAKHVCPLCSKIYARKQHLRRHTRSAHSSTLEDLLPKKDYKCKTCSKSYGRLQYLRRHMQLHHVTSVRQKSPTQKPVTRQLPKPLKKSQPKPLSAWEKIRRDNIREKELFLRSLDNEP